MSTRQKDTRISPQALLPILNGLITAMDLLPGSPEALGKIREKTTEIGGRRDVAAPVEMILKLPHTPPRLNVEFADSFMKDGPSYQVLRLQVGQSVAYASPKSWDPENWKGVKGVNGTTEDGLLASILREVAERAKLERVEMESTNRDMIGVSLILHHPEKSERVAVRKALEEMRTETLERLAKMPGLEALEPAPLVRATEVKAAREQHLQNAA